jgi:hypothetical protein
LPIGNQTSQVFANFYMHQFDAFVTKQLGIKNYGRYVDDFLIVHSDKEYLKALIPPIGIGNYPKNHFQYKKTFKNWIEFIDKPMMHHSVPKIGSKYFTLRVCLK